MSGPVLFVSGTDTGIGKTVVSCGLTEALVRLGKSVAALKLAETGAGGDEAGPDTAALFAVANANQKIIDICPFSFAEPAAPNVAAKDAGYEITFGEVVSSFEKLPAAADVSLVEGAGGILVPLSDSFTFADVVEELRLPVLLVVGSRLGAINHASLTFEVLVKRGIKVLGYVLNDCYPADGEQGEYELALRTNREEIAKVAARYGITELGYVPFISDGAEGTGAVFDDLAANVLTSLAEVVE